MSSDSRSAQCDKELDMRRTYSNRVTARVPVDEAEVQLESTEKHIAQLYKERGTRKAHLNRVFTRSPVDEDVGQLESSGERSTL